MKSPGRGVLVARLRDRQTESGEQVRQRLARARTEMEAAREYDYIVVNDDLVVAVEQVAAILEAESLRRSRQSDLETVIRDLQDGVTAAEAESPTP